MTDLTPLLSDPDVSIAVVGATDAPGKYGGIIYRDLKRKGYKVFAVNPTRDSVDGDPCWANVQDLPQTPTIVDLVVPAIRGLRVVSQCEAAGIENIWVQPGAESRELLERLESGPFTWLAHACIMVRARPLTTT
ncbi:MAG: CoA-binding protein [Acidimicrobiia bacterium]